MWSIFKFQRLVDGHNVLSLSDTSSDQSPPVSPPPSVSSTLQISAVAPPPTKTIPKRLVLKSLRTKRKFLSGDNDDGEENGDLFFIDGGRFIDINDDDSFWGGGSGEGGNGGKRWNFDAFGGANWGESLNNSFYDPAFDFVYEVLSWIALSNCLHFAFKKVEADRLGDSARKMVLILLIQSARKILFSLLVYLSFNPEHKFLADSW